ncbi:MAG: hypothetical protein V1747_03560 [Candidatus Omnitrophota bacterium]
MGSRSTVLKHEKIFDFLVELHEKDNNFFFVPRKINNKKRFEERYWFIGNDKYLQVSFWDGGDWKEKIHNIGFVVDEKGNSYIEISGQDSQEKAKFLRKVAERLGGFQKQGNKNKWHRNYDGNHYLANLKDFLNNVKPVIDSMIEEYKPKGIAFLDSHFYKKYVEKIIQLRKEQQEFGTTNKVARICWNTEGWKFPSGAKGKSSDSNSYEAQYGYGHEEWLLDKSRILDGFHYAFLEPFRVESGKHVGNIYNVALYTISGAKKRFYVGDIKEISCLSSEEATIVYKMYKTKGWIEELIADIKNVGGNPVLFQENFNSPELIFNIKFRFDNVKQFDELIEISDEDINITTSRFKLIPKKTNFLLKEGFDDEDEGKKRSEKKRIVVFKKEVEYDPYHSKMQNALTLLLREQYKHEYVNVQEEKGRIDIKARTLENEWHYFEIKTEMPKLCIRQALGQIMEYAYWPDIERAKKLIIIGDSFPDDDTKSYMKYIRENFSIPVVYRCFDMERKALSEDF